MGTVEEGEVKHINEHLNEEPSQSDNNGGQNEATYLSLRPEDSDSQIYDHQNSEEHVRPQQQVIHKDEGHHPTN